MVETVKAVCNYCFKPLATSINGTCHLSRHAAKCKPRPNDSQQSQLGPRTSVGGDNVMNTFTYSQSRMREGLAIYTAASEQPFSFGQDPNFV